MKSILLSLASAALLAAPALAQQAAWLHVAVRDGRHDRARVRINLPAPVVIRVAPLIPACETSRCRLVAGEESLTARDLASLLADLGRAPDGATVRRDTGDALVEARRTGDRIDFVVTDELGGDTVAATLPLPVAQALAGTGRRLDLARAVRLLASAGGGELALVAADRSRIRIWVDTTPDQVSEWR